MDYRVFYLVLITCFSSLSVATPTNSENPTPSIQQPKTCFRGVFASYESWLDTLKTKKKNFNEKAFTNAFPKSKYEQRQQQVECVDFTYQSDGFDVEGYYLKPKNAQGKLPVVIFNRGGNGPYGYVIFPKKMGFIADIASAGYVVVGSQYRGSSRHIDNNGQDEFGGADVNDVLQLLTLLEQIPKADADNVALMGWSRGAMQAYLAARQMPKIKTIVAIAGNADVKQALEWRPEMENVYQKRVPDFAQNRESALQQRSVIHWIDALPKVPILLVHGDQDERVNAEQSRILAAALTQQNHAHKLVIYADDGHSLHRHKNELVSEVVAWLEATLK